MNLRCAVQTRTNDWIRKCKGTGTGILATTRAARLMPVPICL